MAHRSGPESVEAFAADHSQPGDIVVVPVREAAMSSVAAHVFESGRSVLAVIHNPESQSSTGVNTMSLPVGRAT